MYNYIKQKLILSTIYFFRLQKIISEKPEIPENAFLCYCLCFYWGEKNKNHKSAFLNLFDENLLFDITKILLIKFLEKKRDSHNNYVLDQKFLEKYLADRNRMNYWFGLNTLENYFQTLIYPE